MKNKKDEVVIVSHAEYKEFNRHQFIVDLDIGDRVQIKVFNKDGKKLAEKEFIAKYINCLINCQWQDKGIKEEKLKSNIKI